MSHILNLANAIIHKDPHPLCAPIYAGQCILAEHNNQERPFILSKKERIIKRLSSLINAGLMDRARVYIYNNSDVFFKDGMVSKELIALLFAPENVNISKSIEFFEYLRDMKWTGVPGEKSDISLFKTTPMPNAIESIRNEIQEVCQERLRNRIINRIYKGEVFVSRSPVGSRDRIRTDQEEAQKWEIETRQYFPVGCPDHYPYPKFNRIVVIDKTTFFTKINLILMSMSIDLERILMGKGEKDLDDEQNWMLINLINEHRDKSYLVTQALDVAIRNKYITKDEYEEYRSRLQEINLPNPNYNFL